MRLLGPVELWRGDRAVPLGPRQQRCVLAVLAMTPGRPVPTELLVDRLWGERLPRQARNGLYTTVSRLRGILGRSGVTLRQSHGGYVLELDPEDIDLHRARRLTARARERVTQRPDQLHCPVRLLRAADALWRGVPLSDLQGDWADRARHALVQERLGLVTERYELELRAGYHADAIAPLSHLHAEHPLAEALAELLMRALVRSGHRTEALQVYDRVRTRLATELEVVPGPQLQRLRQRIMQGEP